MVIARSILEQGSKVVGSKRGDVDLNDFRRGIQDAVAEVSRSLDAMARPVDTEEQVR